MEQQSIWGCENVLLLGNDYYIMYTLWKLMELYCTVNFLLYFNHIYIFFMEGISSSGYKTNYFKNNIKYLCWMEMFRLGSRGLGGEWKFNTSKNYKVQRQSKINFTYTPFSVEKKKILAPLYKTHKSKKAFHFFF